MSGCVTPSWVSKRIVTAPNLQNPAMQVPFDWVRQLNLKENPLRLFNVPVGPPEAILSLAELPPANYGVEVVSSVKYLANGKATFLLTLTRDPAAVVTPVSERGMVFLLHGYGLQKETMMPWAFVLAKAGYRVMMVDTRGHGRSTGETFYCGKYEPADFVQMLDYLRKQPGHDGKVGVLGLSMGADLALMWAARDPRVETVVAMAPYNHPEEALVRFAQAMKIPVGRKTLNAAMHVSAAKLDLNWSELSGEFAMRHLAQPVLFVGGDKDTVSPPSDLESLQELASGPTKRIMIADANHFVIGFCFEQLAGPITAWLNEYVSAPIDARRVRQNLSAPVKSPSLN